MSDFTLHTKDTAPEAAKPLIDNSVSAFGMPSWQRRLHC